MQRERRVFWLDATLIAKTSVPSHWLKDGYHPSVIANMRLAKAIKKIYKGDIEHKVSENTDSQYDPKFSCSFNIHKSGNDDKQNAYEYIQVEGELDIDYDLTFFGGYTIRYTRENWKISDASPTYLRDNMKDAVCAHANGNLHGILNMYSNSRRQALWWYQSLRFESSNNSKYLLRDGMFSKSQKQ